MAEMQLVKLEDQLLCSICLDTYTDPKLLQCFHSYCRRCLVPLVVPDQRGQLGITCPTCRHPTPIPNEGVAGLQPAFHINYLLKITDSLQVPEKLVTTPINKTRHCLEHEGKELELYCETCGELACFKCAVKGSKHFMHDYDELHQAFKRYKLKIMSTLEPMEEQVATIMKALAQLDVRCGEIGDLLQTISMLPSVNSGKSSILGRLHLSAS